jgi:alkanesulfonate monooxygenase SsuD/methylene tetrahydromethanopterin reductase-like flavin-dependent oxidoreductase (luciferase family)
MIGGGGERYTLRAVARHADWWNSTYRRPASMLHKLSVLREHCEAEGRDYDSIRKTVTARVFIARSQSKALALAGDGLKGDEPVMAGDPAAVRDQILALADVGLDLFIAVFPSFQELDDMRLFVDEVMPAFASPALPA